MPEIQNLQTVLIDPNSSVNVRRSQISQNVELVQHSISQLGYWPSYPITVRPHPNLQSPFQYEVVVGQCRLRACLNLGLGEIPAVVLALDSNNAIQQSWAENEFRGELAPSDKAYWIHQIVRRYTDEGRTLSDAREIAAAFFNISAAQVIEYHPLIGLSEDLKEMLDKGELQLQDAKVIAKHTNDFRHPQESEQRMRERVEWIQGLDVDSRKAARRAIQHSAHNTPVDQLKKEVEKELDRRFFEERVQIPEEMYPRLVAWGEERGLVNVSTAAIIKFMIVNALKGA